MSYKDLAKEFNKTQDDMYELILGMEIDPENMTQADISLVKNSLNQTETKLLSNNPDIFEGGEIGSHSIDQSEMEADEETSALIQSGNNGLDNADRVVQTEQENFKEYRRAADSELRSLKLTRAEIQGAVEQQELIAARKRGAMQVLEIHHQQELQEVLEDLEGITQQAGQMSTTGSESIVRNAQSRSIQNQALLANFTKRLGSSKR